MAARWAPFLALLITGMSLGALAQDAAPSFRQLVREGHRLRSTGNLRGASAKYGAAIEAAANDGELAEALQAHAVAQRNLGRDDQAEADLRRAIALPNAGALRRPAMLQLAALLEAQTRLDEAIELYLNVAAGLRDRPEEAAQTLLTAARLLLDSDRLQEAREALAGVEPEALPPQLRSEAAGLRLEVALASGDVAAAQAAIREAGVEGADLSQLHVRLARLLFEDDRPDEALAACEAAIEADPANSSAWRVQLDIATAKGTADALVSQVEARLRADPGNEVLAQRVAYYAEWDEDADRALAAFRSLLALRPQDSALLERAGARAAQSGRNAEALEFYEAALKLQPDDAGLCFMIGEAHAKLGNRAQAVAALEQGTRFRPGDPESAQRLGMTLARAGLHDEAAALYRETRELLGDPDALAYELAEALAPVRPEEALGEYLRAAAGGLDEATLVAPEAVRLARSADLLPRLADLAQATLAERPVAGVALLLAVTEAALGRAGESVERLQSLGLAPPELMAIAESLEAQGVREAAADLYATVVTHPDASAGLRLELAVRAAETQIALGRPEDARTVLAAALAGGAGPASLAEPAAFLLADLDLAAGRNLAQARETFAALTRYSTHPDLPRRARWRLADLAFAEGDYAAAEERFAQLAQEPPSLDIALPPAPPGFLIPRNGL
ncbi:MAG: tetratricopeptide repeat protein, partial [Armatimonadetes bacterium]|nr:tetratricopeptide repeat protein [Armatimonadota bacterium]